MKGLMYRAHSGENIFIFHRTASYNKVTVSTEPVDHTQTKADLFKQEQHVVFRLNVEHLMVPATQV